MVFLILETIFTLVSLKMLIYNIVGKKDKKCAIAVLVKVDDSMKAKF